MKPITQAPTMFELLKQGQMESMGCTCWSVNQKDRLVHARKDLAASIEQGTPILKDIQWMQKYEWKKASHPAKLSCLWALMCEHLLHKVMWRTHQRSREGIIQRSCCPKRCFLRVHLVLCHVEVCSQTIEQSLGKAFRLVENCCRSSSRIWKTISQNDHFAIPLARTH